MGFFVPVDNSIALLRKSGVFSEAPVFVYDSILYAKHHGGYVRLKPEGGTSVPKLTWEEIDIDPIAGAVVFDTFNAKLLSSTPRRPRPKKIQKGAA